MALFLHNFCLFFDKKMSEKMIKKVLLSKQRGKIMESISSSVTPVADTRVVPDITVS